MLKDRFKHFATISNFSEDFRRRPKTSEDFRGFSKISETCWNVGFLHSPVLFPKFSKELSNIQQRIRESYFCGLIKF